MEKIKGMLGIRDFRNALAPIAGSFYFQKSSKSEFNILLTGLDIAGKTTFLYGLNLGKVKTDIPFIGMNIEKLQYRNIQFCSWDVGGGCKPGTYLILRSLFRHSKGIIIVVDCNDRERIVEVREELQTRIFEEDRDARKRCPQVLEKIWEKQDAERDFLMGLPMLVLANKQDIEGAMSADEISARLHLGEKCQGRRYRVQPCSTKTNEGVYEGLEWLSKAISAAGSEDKTSQPEMIEKPS